MGSEMCIRDRENADDVVKEAADQIAGRNDQDGVGKELEKIFGNAGK